LDYLTPVRGLLLLLVLYRRCVAGARVQTADVSGVWTGRFIGQMWSNAVISYTD